MSIVAEKIDFKERPPESPTLQAKDKGVTYLAPLASAMAASSGDDVPTQLAALLGREIFRIRKTDETPPGVSIIDVVMAVTGGSQHDAARSLRRLSDQYPEVGPNWSHLLQAAPRCKQAGKRRTLRPPVLKKSNPVSQGEDDALKMSNPPRWRHRVRFFRRAIRVRARGFEISVRLGEQPTNQENTELKKSISKKDFQVKKNVLLVAGDPEHF